MTTESKVMDEIWGAMYPGSPTGWADTDMVVRHVKAVVEELAKARAYSDQCHERAEMWHGMLRRATELITFMSGASDFAPDGVAHAGWVTKSRSELNEMQVALADKEQ